MAMLLQSLCVKLGVVTGQDLSQSCRKYFPKWANLILYVLCEIAIMSTDLAEVIGSAIALKLLFHIPLLYGVLITGLDVLVIIMFGFNAKHMRLFEGMIALLVLTTACCLFAVTAKSGPNMGDVAFGYLPSTLIFTNPDALYVAVGIIGATVMPHNLYLHSYIVKYRSNRDDGEIVEIVEFEEVDAESVGSNDTQPLNRIKTLPTTLQMSYLDSSIALTFALFVNSSILIIAGANFYTKGETDIADIEDAFKLIGSYLGSVFAALFAIALLLAGQSSTITGTMAGQIIMEGFLGIVIFLQSTYHILYRRSYSIEALG
jgi:manganese transport protein